MRDKATADAAGLAAAKRALLAYLLEEKGIAPARTPAIARRSGTAAPPLSFAQQRLWFLDQLMPGTAVYNNPTAVRLLGPLAIAALHGSLNAILRRHEALRTTFTVVDGQPAQVIAPALALPLTVLDLRSVAPAARQTVAGRAADAEARRPFDLSRGPLLRALLLWTAPEEQLLVLSMHHIISDGWSMGVLLRELITFYNAAVAGVPATLPELPIQYADYAIWQREWLQGTGDWGLGTGDWGLGTGDWGQGDKETRRQGDKETRNIVPQHPTPNTQRPTPNTQHPTPNTQHPTPIQAQLDYWKRQLADLPVLELPTDRPRALVETFQGTIVPLALPPPLAAALNSLSRRESCTLFMTLLAAWKLLLARYTGQDDLVVGSPIANRTRPEIRDLIGVFVNMLVLRSSLAGNPSFRALLARVRATTLDAYAHQDLPFERLVEELQPARSLNHTPLFQVVLALQNSPRPDVQLAGLTMLHVEVHSGTTKFDLTLNLFEAGQAIAGVAEYNSNLFDAATVARLVGHLQTLLEAAAADPDRAIADLPLLTPAERRQVIEDWNATQADYPRARCIHELFEGQAERAPDAIAVVFDGRTTNDERPPTTDHRLLTTDHRSPPHPLTPSPLHPLTPSPLHPFTQHLTYAELNRRANQLAHRLRAVGVGPEVPVVVFLERSPEMIAGLLGILKAGGLYVPIDPAWPAERAGWIIASLRAGCVVTRSTQLRTLRALQPLLPHLSNLVCLDDAEQVDDAAGGPRTWSAGQLARMPEHNPPAAATAANTAYIIYTSGSTGVPKGVVVRHRPVINLIDWVNRTYRVGPDDRVLCVASLCFDLSVYDIFGLLAAGGAVQIATEADIEDPQRLLRMLREERITFWDSAPAALQQLALLFPTAPSTGAGDLRLVFLSGDWIPLTLPGQVRAAFPRAVVIGLGGATEATVWSNYYPIGAVDRLWLSIPYGKPIQNARYYVLDAHLNPCPIGVPGDLHIGGECLADGYMNDPAQTAERFIPNPFAGDKETRRQGDKETGDNEASTQNSKLKTQNLRLYRTGDLARFWADGTMEFLGRVDHQVKIRGFRIELGEIQAVLSQHPAVRECVVLDREDVPGNKRLVAYVVPKIEDRRLKIEDSNLGSSERLSSIFYPLSSELRAFLQARLPAYMVPAAFVLLEGIPLTANGKVDRRALPAPDTARPELEQAFVPPRGHVEELLAGIWANLLRLERVGARDNFFALGGDSILSLQAITRANQAGLRLTPRHLFLYQTIVELAAVAGTAQAIAAEQGPVTGPAPLTPIQRWFFAQNLADPQHFNQALLLEARQELDSALLARALRQLLRHHDALRLRFTRAESGWRQVNAAPDEGAALPFARIDLSRLPEAACGLAIAAAAAGAQASLDLADGPLLRVVLFDLGAARSSRLLLVIHHLATDGVSWRILLDDLQALYGQLSLGAAAALPPKTTSFKRWAERLAAYARSDEARAERDYWPGLPWERVYPLPVDTPGGANTVAVAGAVTAALDGDETRALLQEAPAAYHTRIDDLLLAALAQAFARWTGERALLVDLEGHGREDLFADVDLSRTVGWFTSLYPVLLDLGEQDAPGALIMAVKEQLRAIPRRGIGYGLLRYLSDDREVAARMEVLPQAEVSFTYLGQFEQLLPEASPLRLAHESSGPARSSRGRRGYLLEISALVVEGRLRVDWIYSQELHRRATISRLAEGFLAALRALIAHCRSPEAGGFTPSDFPLAAIDQRKLDRLFTQLDDDESEE